MNTTLGDDGDSPHTFGGPWTTAKLSALALYLSAYTTALKDQHFRKWYIDAFAGSGDRADSEADAAFETRTLPGFDSVESERSWSGSARIALNTQPAFDHFVFIEQNGKWCEQLAALRTEFGRSEQEVEILRGDANEALRRLSASDWRGRRAVLFLDPYGMQVDWTTLEAVARSRAMDVWILFPLGTVIRLMTRSGEMPVSWRRALDRVFGTGEWIDALYKPEPQRHLFGDDDERTRSTTDVVARYYNLRLRTLFPAVAANPVTLRNSRNAPLYLLCFAASNRAGAPIALRIAEHLLKGLV